MLTELVRKRERKKLERANALRAAVEGVVFPLEARMRDTLEAIRACVLASLPPSLPPGPVSLRAGRVGTDSEEGGRAGSTSSTTLRARSTARPCRTTTT